MGPSRVELRSLTFIACFWMSVVDWRKIRKVGYFLILSKGHYYLVFTWTWLGGLCSCWNVLTVFLFGFSIVRLPVGIPDCRRRRPEWIHLHLEWPGNAWRGKRTSRPCRGCPAAGWRRCSRVRRRACRRRWACSADWRRRTRTGRPATFFPSEPSPKRLPTANDPSKVKSSAKVPLWPSVGLILTTRVPSIGDHLQPLSCLRWP